MVFSTCPVPLLRCRLFGRNSQSVGRVGELTLCPIVPPSNNHGSDRFPTSSKDSAFILVSPLPTSNNHSLLSLHYERFHAFILLHTHARSCAGTHSLVSTLLARVSARFLEPPQELPSTRTDGRSLSKEVDDCDCRRGDLKSSESSSDEEDQVWVEGWNVCKAR